jgi:uncharacterized protein YeaO (DUF488 family)
MAVRIVRLGCARVAREGLRIGTVRRAPRGVRKSDYSRLNYFDVWLPELAPSPELFRWARSKPWTGHRWATFAKRYTREMREPGRHRLIQLLAQLSHQANFSVGCYCRQEDQCHRSILRQLLIVNGAKIAR